MERMHLVQTDTSDLTLLPDSDLAAFFAEFGLEAEVVAHCDEVSCPACDSSTTVRAA